MAWNQQVILSLKTTTGRVQTFVKALKSADCKDVWTARTVTVTHAGEVVARAMKGRDALWVVTARHDFAKHW